jgi:hypothetical protein
MKHGSLVAVRSKLVVLLKSTVLILYLLNLGLIDIKISTKIHLIFKDYTDLMEPLSLDEALFGRDSIIKES